MKLPGIIKNISLRFRSSDRTNDFRGNVVNEAPTRADWRATTLTTRVLLAVSAEIDRSLLFVPENLCAVVVIFHGILYETEAVDITDVRLTVCTKEVEAAHGLLFEKKTFNFIIL